MTQSGKSVCNFSVAVNRRLRNQQTGQYDTDFFDVQAWQKLGELCEQYLDKGRSVAVFGEMQSRNYEGRDGSKKTAWSILADDVDFIGSGSSKNSNVSADAGGETDSAPAAPAGRPLSRQEARALAKQAAQTNREQAFVETDEDLPF